MTANPLEPGASPSEPSRRRVNAADIVAAAMAVAVMLVWTDVADMAATVLVALTGALIIWPAGFLAVLIRRWGRQHDWRYVGSAVVLLVVAGLSAFGAIYFAQ
ncbi:MAG: hypothetical protein WD358_01405 [Nitriliruptoraceae bacterium]